MSSTEPTIEDRCDEIKCTELDQVHLDQLCELARTAINSEHDKVSVSPDDLLWLLFRVAEPRMPLKSVSNADAGDYTTVCAACDSETDEPHEPSWCLDQARRSGSADADIEGELALAKALGISDELHGVDHLLELVSEVVKRVHQELGHPRHMEAAMRGWLRRVHYLAECMKRCEPPEDWVPKAAPWLVAGSAAREPLTRTPCRIVNGPHCGTEGFLIGHRREDGAALVDYAGPGRDRIIITQPEWVHVRSSSEKQEAGTRG